MIETKDIAKMVKHIVRRDKGVRDPQIMHPSREWFTGLLVATAAVLLGSWFCYSVYHTYLDKAQTDIPVGISAVPYQAAVVEEALKLIETKEKKYQEILEKAGANQIPLDSENTDSIDEAKDNTSTPADITPQTEPAEPATDTVVKPTEDTAPVPAL